MRPMLTICLAALFGLGLWSVADATDEGVEHIEDLWEDAIDTDDYEDASGDTSHYPSELPSAPEGIYGWTLQSGGDTCNWCWVRARAQDNSSTKRWVHTSMWAVNEHPYWSKFYCVNNNASYNYIPKGDQYYMSAFRWHAITVQRVAPQPVTEPDNPDSRTSAYVSGVYLTPYEYDNPPGGKLQQVADLTCDNLESW